MTEARRIGKFQVKKVGTGELVTLESFWASQPCVIVFLRRFGCAFCRLGARELSAIKPLLDSNNVRFVGIGLEELGLDEFLKGEFFSGELYIDTTKSCYEALEFKRYNPLTILPAILTKKSRDYYSKSKEEGIEGNLKGDTLQTGGILVVDKGGERVLLSFKQDNPADHIDNEKILSALNISVASPMPNASPKTVSKENASTK